MHDESISGQKRPEATTRTFAEDLLAEKNFQSVARLAAQLCNASVAAVVSKKFRNTPLGEHGAELSWTAEQRLPWDDTLASDGFIEIVDTELGWGETENGLLLGEQAYRSYAGVPLRTPEGVALGCLAVLDKVPRRLSPVQIDSLQTLADLAMSQFEVAMAAEEAQRTAEMRAQAEAALTAEKNFVAAVLETIGALVVVFDTAGRIVQFNRFCELLSGYPAAELVGTYAWEHLIPPEDLGMYRARFERARRGEFPIFFENDWLTVDGSRRRISWSTTALTDAQAQVTYIITTGIDITVQNEAELAIRESERRYREIVEGSLGLVCTHDLEGRVLSMNEEGAHGLGRSVREVVGQNLSRFIFPEFEPELQGYLEALTASGEAKGLLRMQHGSGEQRVLAYRNRLVTPVDSPPHVLAFAVDITEQVNAEERLRQLIRQSDSVLESIGDGIYGIDLEGRATVVNPAAARMLGYTAEELLGRNMHELVQHHHADGTVYELRDCSIQQSLRELTPLRSSHDVFWRKDGTNFPVEYVACPQIESSEGSAVGVVVAFTDISERNALDRMKDEFISTVSHELRTPLTSLRAALGLVAAGRLSGDPDRTQQMMDIAVESTDRLVRLVNDILDLERIHSGSAEMHFNQCSLASLFERTTALLQPAAARAGVRLVPEATDVVAWADSDRLLQTLTNLVSNAIKFAPPEDRSGGETEVVMTARYGADGEVVLQVRDYGRGIPADQLHAIFERFTQIDASDSRAMGGTGLGLAICRAIVAQHGGSIWATSTLGEGSTFHITLPRRGRVFLHPSSI